MLLTKDSTELENFSVSMQMEWLETNGLGGWSGSSLCGCHTRRYHGLLMAATRPPTERMLLVSKLDETIVLNGSRYELGVNDYGDSIYPQGFQYLKSFKKDFFPEWIYEAGGIRLRKTITMVYGENSTLIRYEVLNTPRSFHMELLPLIAARGYHQLQKDDFNIFWQVDFENGLFHNQPLKEGRLLLYPAQTIQPGTYGKKFNYVEEKYRTGLSEDLFNHGLFTVELKTAT
jgi:predicted glycogen debranching enzyme